MAKVLTLLFACLIGLVAGQYGSSSSLGGYAGTAVSSPLDTIKLAIANRSPEEASRYGVDIGLVDRAQALLDDGLQIPAHERMDIAWAGVTGIPMVWPAYQFYLQYGQGQSTDSYKVRRFLLSLLESGMSADVDYLGEGLIDQSWIQLPLSHCLNTREDVEVCLALMRAGHPTDPVIGNWNAYNSYGQQFVQGVSYFNLIAVGASGVPIMRVFYRMDRQIQNGLKTPEQTMRENLIQKYVAYTPSLNELVEGLTKKEPVDDRMMSNNRLKRLDVEIEIAELAGLFNFTDIDMREIEVSAPWNDYNALHYCAIMEKPRFVELFLEQFEALEDGPYRDQVASSIKKAVEFKSQFAGRNPLHLSAVRYGHDSDTFKAMLALEIAAHGDDSRIEQMRDDYGLSPYDYDGPSDSVNTASLAGYGEPTFHPGDFQPDDFNGYPYTDADSGGWGVAEDDIDFNNSNAGIIVNGRSRCDIPEFEGMPTPEEVGLWLERNEPVMWRNAVRDWSIRDNWKKENFVKHYSSREISTAHIPYAESFDNTAGITKKTTMGEYIKAWGKSDETWADEAIPEYMFSGQFTEENPDIDDDMPEFLDLLAKLPYPTKIMAKQLFVGPAMSGAPMHWHNTAMNALAYGRKHWYLLRPNQTFYSVWPTKYMVKEELDNLNDQGYEVLQCSQNAGDLLLVGQSWGHATLNQHPTIGMAIEFTYRVLSTEMQLPNFMKEMATPAGQAKLQAAGGQAGQNSQNLFVQLDADQDGFLSRTEFSVLGDTSDVKNLFRNDDINGDNMISWDEFTGPKGDTKPAYIQNSEHTRLPGSSQRRTGGGDAGATYLQQRSPRRGRREL